MPPKFTLHDFQARKEAAQPITMLTAYDYPTARLLDAVEAVDVILIGDSVGMAVHGFENTLPVTLEMMIMHCAAVRRGAKRAMLLADLPFMSYQVSPADALRSAGRLLAEGGADAIKLEGGAHMAPTVEALVQAGVAVMAHIGLTPQSVSALGGFKAQGKSLEAARRLIAAADTLQAAGAFGLLLEAVPARLAALISRRLNIATVGIGAGAGCDGQVLVLHDLLGLSGGFAPRFARRYTDLEVPLRQAVEAYCQDVRTRQFPAQEHTFGLAEDVYQALTAEFGTGEGG